MFLFCHFFIYEGIFAHFLKFLVFSSLHRVCPERIQDPTQPTTTKPLGLEKLTERPLPFL